MDYGSLVSAGQSAIGGIQSIIGGIKAQKYQKQLQKMVSDYQPNRGILDFYNKALQRYDANPYTSSLYTNAANNIRSGTAQGLNQFQDRRSALAGIAPLVENQNRGLLKAAAAAEGQQGQALNELGQATAMKAGEDKYKFENQYNLLAMRAGAANNLVNAGLTNLVGGGQSYSQMQMLKNMYGDGSGKSADPNSGSGGGGITFDDVWRSILKRKGQ